jgi:hypothetical protein
MQLEEVWSKKIDQRHDVYKLSIQLDFQKKFEIFI